MSALTTLTRPFTISTYDPPSTPIALAAANESDETVAGRRKTPPQQDSEGSGRGIRPPGQSPPTHEIVTEWMKRLDLEDDGQSQEGMFGPYASHRSSQIQSRTQPPDTAAPGPASRPTHPFAYNATGTVPFQMRDDNAEMGATDYLSEQVAAQQRSGRPESDLLSRGAGVPGGARSAAQAGMARPSISRDQSPGMGTFGRDGSQAPVNAQKSSPIKRGRKAVPAEPGSMPPDIPLPPRPAKSAVGTMHTLESAALPESATIAPHVHHPHHDYAFDPAEAQRKQSEAMAHAAALARLEAARVHQPARPDGVKGPRETFETMTSEPSFGHLYHRDGQAITRETSMMPPPRQPDAWQREGIETPFFRIPFGIPLSAQIPRPMLVTRQGTSIGFGLGGIPPPHLTAEMDGGPRLVPVESPETVGRKTPKSAYVESVEDEQAPRTIAKGAPSMGTGIGQETEVDNLPERPPKAASRTTAPLRTHRPQVPDPTSSRLPMSTPKSQAASSIKAPSDVPAYRSKTRSAHTQASDLISNASTTTMVAPKVETVSVNGSIAPTTVSNVKKIINDSSYHDEVLCQLLDGSRLNLLGSAAKQALLRAARARVIELRDLRANGDLDEVVPDLPSLSQLGKGKRDKKARKGRSVERSHRSREDKTVQPRSASEGLATPAASPPPPWAQSLIDRLATFEARLDQVAAQDRDFPITGEQAEPDAAPSQDLNLDMLHDLMFDIPPLATAGLGGIFGLPMQHFGPHRPDLQTQQNPSAGGCATPKRSAYLQTLSPSDRTVREGTGDNLQWGSEVEMPALGESVSSPQKTGPPIINIQAPTESHMTRSQRAVTQSARSNGAEKLPPTVETNPGENSGQEIFGDGAAAMPDPRDRDLPPTPSESIRSHFPHQDAQLPTTDASSDPLAVRITQPAGVSTFQSAGPSTFPQADLGASNSIPVKGDGVYRAAQTTYQTALETQPSTESIVDKLIIHPKATSGNDSGVSGGGKLTIWDAIGQRLFNWAVLWTEEQLKHELEEISLGKQVDDLALTIWFMNQYKRLIRRSLSHDPPVACEKMIVPPLVSEAINKAVHSQNFQTAVQLLRDLWHSFGFQERPRVVIALSRHRNETHQWSAHRFDLITHKMVTYRVTSFGDTLGDGRPFMWWHALREAWPECDIPEPSEMAHRVETVQTPVEDKYKNSLLAANMARNLLLGYKVERECNLDQMRENVFEEVRVLYKRKKAGDLTVSSDTYVRGSPDHASPAATAPPIRVA